MMIQASQQAVATAQMTSHTRQKFSSVFIQKKK
jgi:hypothetical protein